MSDFSFKSVSQFSETYPAFSEGAIRHLIFLSKPRPPSKGNIPGNGFAPAFIRLGRKILIDEAKFFDIVKAKQLPQDAA